MTILNNEIQNLLLAAILGAVLGLEREWSGKSAGFRTLMLVSVGSALFTIVSYQMAFIDVKHQSDVTRIASNIVTGIGFIGAGLIFRGDKTVHGLTTAATVWAAAAIGMAAGIGNYILAVEATFITWAILVVLLRFERYFERLLEIRRYQLTYNYTIGEPIPVYTDFFADKGFKLLTSKLEKRDGNLVLMWTVRATKKHHDGIVKVMLQDPRILKVEY